MVLFFIKEQPPQKIIANEITSGTKISNINEYLHHPFYETTIKQAFFIFIRDKRFLLIASSMMGLTILWDFLNFVPLYLNEILNISTSESATATAAFPIGSLISVLIGGFLFDKLSKQAISYAMGCYLGVAVLSLTFLLALPHFELNLRTNLIATLAALFLFGFTVSPAYYLPMSIFSIEYGGPHTGILIALLDAIGFAASVVFSFVGGRISNQTGGWFYFLFLLIIIAIFSWAVTFWFLIGEAKQTVSISRN
jgi:sugar phosphate permease